MKHSVAIALLLGSLFANLSEASETQISRYLSIQNKPRHEQVDLMSQIVQVRFPQSVQTVGQGISYILRYSGYRLIPESKMNKSFIQTLSMPLPLVDRELGPVTLKSALSMLAGQGFILETNPITREINFEIKPSYKKYIQ